MTSGTLCAIVCPILEDELIYNIVTDAEKKNVFLVTNDNTRTIIPKLDAKGIEYTMIGERSFIAGNESIPEMGYNLVIWMMDLGLHQEPDDLKVKMREMMTEASPRCDAIILYMGLCGQALTGVEEWGKENLSVPVTIMKDANGRICDDCICVPLDGTDNYLKLLKKYTGVLYLTPAMAINRVEFRSKMDLFRGTDSNDLEFMKMILEMAGYKNALEIDTGLYDDKEFFHHEAQAYADETNLELLKLEPGWVSTNCADRTYAEAKGFLSD